MTYEDDRAARTIDPELVERIGEQVEYQLRLLQETAELIGGEGARIEDVFPEPPEVRTEAPAPEWTTEQVEAARDAAHQLGYGAEHNVPSGLQGGRRILEGGLRWKQQAEEAAVDEEEGVGELIYAGSPERVLGDPERAAIQKELDQLEGSDETTETLRLDLESLLRPDATEYDQACVMAIHKVAPETLAAGTALPFGYEILEGNRVAMTHETTGQLVQIGFTATGQSVRALRVDREWFTEEGTGKRKYNQPDSAALMGFVSGVADAEGAPQDPVGLVTSSTYASRVPAAIRASLTTGHQHGVTMYGRETLATVKNEPIKADSPLNQLPGDLNRHYLQLRLLKQDLATAA